MKVKEKMVIVHCVTVSDDDYPTNPVNVASQAKRDTLELMFNDFFHATNAKCVEIEFTSPKRDNRLTLNTITEARAFLRDWDRA
jgi:hypothetical protein